jgi:hypothetical protein
LREVETSVPHDVVVTHDGERLFAYAADLASVSAARDAIESALRHDGIGAELRMSHWDDELDDWKQTDPPATPEEERTERAATRDTKAIETRTLVASSGKLIRSEFEQTLLDWPVNSVLNAPSLSIRAC